MTLDDESEFKVVSEGGGTGYAMFYRMVLRSRWILRIAGLPVTLKHKRGICLRESPLIYNIVTCVAHRARLMRYSITTVIRASAVLLSTWNHYLTGTSNVLFSTF
ncbi:hypothetical protein KC19_2G247100 [Ceratodon purpureus]|uniref:Uncharacterized protein n=1 Tax=Ceratodon purpureus TaxID=3225 RepID=A0A8T0J0F3_CERPU|nr:hypothetical protein KC19_2G247100 [Ceratodon purpureus]